MRVHFSTYFDTQDLEVSESGVLDLTDRVMIDLEALHITDISDELEQVIYNIQFDYFDESDNEDSYESEEI